MRKHLPNTRWVGSKIGLCILTASSPKRLLEGKIASLGGINPLLHYHDSGLSGIELSKAHPGGIPQFVTGKTVLLSHLVRDEIALKRLGRPHQILLQRVIIYSVFVVFTPYISQLV